MVSEGERCAFPTWIDRCFLVREEDGHYEGEDLGVATDADGENHPFISDG